MHIDYRAHCSSSMASPASSHVQANADTLTKQYLLSVRVRVISFQIFNIIYIFLLFLRFFSVYTRA